MRKYIAIIGVILLIAAASTAYATTAITNWNDAKVAGGGSIVDGTKTFGIVSQEGVYKGSYGYKGTIEYVDHSAIELKLHSYKIEDLKCTRTNPTTPDTSGLYPCTAAKITGLATVNGESDHSFEVTVEDNGEPGFQGTPPPDWFSISIDGVLSASGFLTGGNIQVFGQAYVEVKDTDIKPA